MYNGRHCTENDYSRMVELTNHFFALLDSNNPSYQDYRIYLYNEIQEFDSLLAEKFIEKSKSDSPCQIKENVSPIIKELLSNILVDYREHR